ncbi:MAG: ABC transporter permease, partial [Anaerolineae bacterium]|nr:ABC transporter permease [Anaerolineae bacterium]
MTAIGKVSDRPWYSRRLAGLRNGLAIIASSRVAVVGLAIVAFWIVIALLAPVLAPYSPTAQDSAAVNQPPSAQHLMGTDHLGRDILSRLMYGSRTILVLAPISVLAAVVVGTLLGLIGGYYGGLIDEVVMRILDAIMAFPTILLYLIIISAIGPSAVNVVIAITFVGAPGIARLVRSLTLDIRVRDYIAAARLRGENPWSVSYTHLTLP